LSLTADDNHSRAIVVQVIDEAGAVQSGFKLDLFDYDDDWRRWQDSNREAVSDEQGRAEFGGLSKDESYLVRARAGNREGYRQFVLTGDEPSQEANVRLERTLPTSIRVRDEAGNPAAGAWIWTLEHTGANGSVTFNWQSLTSCDLLAEPSSTEGEIRLPKMPPGVVKLRMVHADYAPVELQNIAVGKDFDVTATLRRGVTVTLHVMKATAVPLDSFMIDLRYEPFQNPSTLIGRWAGLGEDGTARLTVTAGTYESLRITHPDYVFTPIYSQKYGRTIGDNVEPIELRPGNNSIAVQLKPKVKVRGRVVNDETGEPVAEHLVESELAAGAIEGPFARFAQDWTHVGWDETDQHGTYELDLAEGRARVSVQGGGMVATPAFAEVDVPPAGSIEVPEIRVRPVPKVRGIVFDEQGKPASSVVVRFRGSMLTYGCEPVITGADGRFELAPPWIPQDFQTHERLPVQTVVAFHPTEPVWAHAEINLGDAAAVRDVTLKLEPQDFDSLVTRFTSDLSPWQRGIVPAEQKDDLAAVSLRGKKPPELDGAHWLNVDDARRSLTDFHGKYVLLQFWTTWCGPCHADMPSLRLLLQLYGRKGLVVIGVHNNSMPLAAIEADVAKEKLEYPIVVDHPDGRILAQYKKHGISGYPSYVLIGPDGEVILDDDTIAGPTLRSFKIEIVRELLGRRDTSR